MQVIVKLLTKSAKLPTKAHSSDACFDLYADIPSGSIEISPGESFKLHTGIATEIPAGYFAAVVTRSGLGVNRGLRLSNSVGIIDADYRGEWLVCLHNDSKKVQTINHGDRIAQFSILPVLDIELIKGELSDTDRGSGGFGSSGK